MVFTTFIGDYNRWFRDTFTATNGTVYDGNWTATITLDQAFPRGTHNLNASFTPAVNLASTNGTTFDSRGYTILALALTLDADPDRFTIRGNNVTLGLGLFDNAGDAVENATVNITIEGLTSFDIMTDSSGFAVGNFSVPSSWPVGFMTINAIYCTWNNLGVVGDETFTRVVILLKTFLTLDSVEGDLVAGQTIYVNGTLLDENGAVALNQTGDPVVGLIHLAMDGIDKEVPLRLCYLIQATRLVEYSIHFATGDHSRTHNVSASFLGGFLLGSIRWVKAIQSTLSSIWVRCEFRIRCL